MSHERCMNGVNRIVNENKSGFNVFPKPSICSLFHLWKDISSFLGMVTYLARFIPDLSTETEKLRKLLRKDTPWEWGKEQSEAFRRLKELVSSDMVVAHFDVEL